MAIRMMIGSVFGEYTGNVEVVHNYRGHETGLVQHGKGCPHEQEHLDLSGALRTDCVERYENGRFPCHVSGPLYMRTTHVGLVLATGEVNGYDDSDFYAVVWNAEKGAPERITYASTRGWTYPNGAAEDATPEVLAAYEAYCKKVRAEAEALRVKERVEREAAAAERAAKAPRKGGVVRVVRGRKVKKGTEGRCFWVGTTSIGAERVGIELANGERVFVAAEYVEAVEVR